eukprot:10327435-Ditylum_brightwellii.AAC.1
MRGKYITSPVTAVRQTESTEDFKFIHSIDGTTDTSTMCTYVRRYGKGRARSKKLEVSPLS